MADRTFEGQGDSQPYDIQAFLERASSLVRDHQGNRLTPHLMRSYPWGLPIHSTIVIYYFLRRIRAFCMDRQPASSLWIVPDFTEIWEFLPWNVGFHIIDFPTWSQPSPTRLVVDMESKKMQFRPCLQLLRELTHPLLQQLHALSIAQAGCTRPFYRSPVGRMRSSLSQDSLLPISRQMLDACRLVALKVSMKPDLVKKFDFMFQVSRLLSTKETRHLPSCVWSAMTFKGMGYSYPICYPASLPLIHPIALPHLKMVGEEAGGDPPKVDGPVLETSLEASTPGRDSGVESEVVHCCSIFL